MRLSQGPRLLSPHPAPKPGSALGWHAPDTPTAADPHCTTQTPQQTLHEVQRRSLQLNITSTASVQDYVKSNTFLTKDRIRISTAPIYVTVVVRGCHTEDMSFKMASASYPSPRDMGIFV